MKLSDLSIKRPVLAVVMSLLLIVLGTMSFLRLTLRELPAIDPPIVSVQVNYPGASAGVVETRITKPLEDALAGIEGINTLDSNSQNGSSRISIEFYATRDIEAAANDVRNAVSRVVDRLPEEADAPEISKVEGRLLDSENGDYIVGVTSVRTIRYGLQVWSGERVRIQQAHVARTYQRRLSRSRTAMFGLAAAGGIRCAINAHCRLRGESS